MRGTHDVTTPNASPTGRAACPNCGQLVPRFQHTSDGHAAEVLACSDCGRFAYSTDGADLPMAVPQDPGGGRPTTGDPIVEA
jgi:predicted RNA-binding Zn-ribbon protein involved in translation (DUF1610 family)